MGVDGGQGCNALAATGGGGLALCKAHRNGKYCQFQGCQKHIHSLDSTMCKGHEMMINAAAAAVHHVPMLEFPVGGSLVSALGDLDPIEHKPLPSI